MLHTKDFEKVLVKSKRLKDVGFKYATVLTFIRRLIDKAWLFSVVNESTETIKVLEATITHNHRLDKAGYEYKWEDWK